MQKSSRIVTSTQQGPHEGLAELLRRHQLRPFSKSFASHNEVAFAQLQDMLGASSQRLILDAGCGSGESTRLLGERYPDYTVLGVDKSAHRLGLRESSEQLVRQENVILIRSDLVDFWRLAATSGWRLAHHFLFYPNPWPKPGHLQRRWHGHAVFESILKLGGKLELRSNWKIYMQEFAQALEVCTGLKSTVNLITPSEFISPFERKYAASGHPLYRLVVDLNT